MKTNIIFHRLYTFLKSLPIINNYIDKISYRYRLINPCNSKTIEKKTVISCLISWTISIYAFFMIYMSNRRLITLITSGFIIYFVNSELVSHMTKRYEIRMLIETESMLSDIVHYYHVKYRIDDAIYRAREHLSLDMKSTVDQIYELLLSTEKEEGLREYYANIPNKYLRSFVSQCVRVCEQGDQSFGENLLFITNLENLQKEINIEIDKLQRLNMEFMGVILCVIAPVFCIDLVKQFAISLKDNMSSFYYGHQGFLLDISLLLIILGIYVIMRRSMEYTVFHLSNYRWLYRIDRIALVNRAMNNYCDKNATRQEKLQRELRNSGSSIKARHFVLRSLILAFLALVLSMGAAIYLRLFSFADLVICICISTIAYCLPFVLLRYGSTVSRDAMEDEVNQFNAIIGMLMHNETITVKQILMEMESFAVVFKQSIRICIDDYASGDIEALNELKEREPYEPFRRIIENLIRCDFVPIYQAFDEIKLDQDGYISRRKLSNEKSIRKRVFRAYVLAALPFIMLFAYGLLPALVSSVSELNQLIEEIENTAWY